jgi:hypothetical protein
LQELDPDVAAAAVDAEDFVEVADVIAEALRAPSPFGRPTHRR